MKWTKHMKCRLLLPLAGTLISAAWGQRLDLSSLDKLSSHASESSMINLEGDKLQTAMGFLSQGTSKDKGTAKTAVDAISRLKGVYVRTFEFEKTGAFTQADLEPIRRQLRAPGWAKIIEVKEKDESNEVYFFKSGDSAGIAVIAAEKNELSVVNLVGPVDLSALGRMGSIMNLPSIQSAIGGAAETPPPAKRQEDEEEDDN